MIRKAVEALVDQGTNAVLVGHSAGAFLGSHALQHLTPKAREEAGKPGAVVKLAFVAGAIFPPGHAHGPAPFMDVQVGRHVHSKPACLAYCVAKSAEISSMLTMTTGRQAILQSSARSSIQ